MQVPKLLVWTHNEGSDVYAAIGGALSASGIEVSVCKSYGGVPGSGATAVLCLGPNPVEVMSAAGVIPKGRTVGSLRNTPFKAPDCDAKMLFSYAVGISKVDYSKFVDLQCDVSAAIRLAKTGSIKPQYGSYKYVDDFREFIKEIEALWEVTKKPIRVALDLETLGLDPYSKGDMHTPGAYIITIQVSHTKGQSSLVYLPSRTAEVDKLSDWGFAEQMDWLLNSPKVKMAGANLKYDLNWLAKRGGFTCSNFKFDTTLVGSLLDENRSNGLDVHCKMYAPELGGYSDEFDKKVDKSRMDKVGKDDMLLYAGGDSDATLRVADVQEVELLKDKPLTSFYVNIMHPAARAFEMVEQGGCLVDMKAYKEVENDLNNELLTLVQKAKSLIGGRLVAKHSDPDKPGGMNLTKASLLTDFMFSPMGLNLKPKLLTAKTKEPSTAIDHLLSFGDVPEAAPFVNLLKDYSSASKTLTTYVTGFLKHLRSDGRYHPSFYFFAGKDDDDNDAGTNTGRLSAKAPAFQTIPKHTKWAKALRRCFVAPPGMLMMERDYSQGELRVIACLAHEENMIQAYLNDLDLHALTSGGFEGYSYEDMMALKKIDKEKYGAIRQLGKAGNFGLIYGMGVDGFFVYAVSNYGVKDFTLEKAAAFRTGFFDRYPDLLTYHAQQKNLAANYGFVRSPLGRIRHLPLIKSSFNDVKSKAERQAINSPTQGTLSDMVLWAAAIENKTGFNLDCPMFGATHDAMYSYVPEDDYMLFGQRGVETMENLPFQLVNWQPQLKFTVDLKVGKNMGDLKEIELPPF